MNTPPLHPQLDTAYMTEELIACLEIGKTLTATRNHKKIFEHIMKCGSRIIKAQHWSLLIKDEQTGNLSFEIVVGADKTLFDPIILGPTEGIAPYVAETGEPMFVSDVNQEPLFNSKVDMKTGFVTRSIVCVPLSIRGSIIGVIEIVNIEDMEFFSQKNYPILSILADYAAIAIDNSKYFEKMQKISITDEYTGLSNARFMHQYLDDFFLDARSHKRNIAAIFMDMDNFKSIVDHYGHMDGSELLKTVGTFLASFIKDKGILIKYGGDEFIILLPDKNSAEAYTLAEELSSQLKETAFPINKDEMVHVSASYGIASSPDNASDKKNLLIAADNALFKAKKIHKSSIFVA